jgi:hypothetical protein
MSNQKPSQRKPLKNALILTGVAFQMGATIYLFVMLGKWLDTTYKDGDKFYIIFMTLAGVALSLYVVLKQTNKLNQ